MNRSLRLPILTLVAVAAAASALAQVPMPTRRGGGQGKPPVLDPRPGVKAEVPIPILDDGKRPFEPMDLMRVRTVARPRFSPDGSKLLFTVTDVDWDANRRLTRIWVAPVDPAAGAPRPLLPEKEWSDRQPAWSPDGKRIAFVSTRGGSAQIWTVAADGSGEPVQVTRFDGGVEGPKWTPDGKTLVFTADVAPLCDGVPCQGARNWEKDKGGPKVTGRVIDRLLFRHWDSWRDGTRTHVFAVPAAGGEPRDLTPGNFDAPPFEVGGEDDVEISPDGKWLLFHRNPDPLEAQSTNVDLYLVPLDGSKPPVNLTEKNKARDLTGHFSPDGKRIAWRAMTRPGFENDRTSLWLTDVATATKRELTPRLDLPIHRFAWFPEGTRILMAVSENGRTPFQLLDLETGLTERLLPAEDCGDFALSPDGSRVAWAGSALDRPTELFVASVADRRATRLTSLNDEVLVGVRMAKGEEVTYPAADDRTIQAWMVKPPDYVPGRRYPLLLWLHGGPQGAWQNEFHPRWNPQPFAAAGFIVFMPNIRGSSGFGQPFTDAVSKDWGGKAYDDAMRGVDWLLTRGLIDRERMGAMGASYGGYLVNFIAGKTDRFAALESHAGIWNLSSFWGSTDELWFPEWEIGGAPWENPEGYTKFSPASLAGQTKTPMLVTHGERDFRVPANQALELFTSMQRRGIPSRLIWFPDEGHWIVQPHNSRLWYEASLDWFRQWLKPVVFDPKARGFTTDRKGRPIQH